MNLNGRRRGLEDPEAREVDEHSLIALSV